jgi:hypothetical protein
MNGFFSTQARLFLPIRFRLQKTVMPEAIWLPFAKAVLGSLAQARLTIILDSTTAGRGWIGGWLALSIMAARSRCSGRWSRAKGPSAAAAGAPLKRVKKGTISRAAIGWNGRLGHGLKERIRKRYGYVCH